MIGSDFSPLLFFFFVFVVVVVSYTSSCHHGISLQQQSHVPHRDIQHSFKAPAHLFPVAVPFSKTFCMRSVSHRINAASMFHGKDCKYKLPTWKYFLLPVERFQEFGLAIIPNVSSWRMAAPSHSCFILTN